MRNAMGELHLSPRQEIVTIGIDRVGGRVASPVRPHHRTYGSVYGGSSAPLQGPELSKKVEETPLRE